MSKFITRCLLFIVLLIIFNLAYFFLLLNFSPGFNKIYTVSKFENKNYELLILGNSMALDGVDASYLSENDIKAYNLAVAGNHISTTVMMLEKYLKKNKTPKTVVVGLSSAVGQSYLNEVPYNNPEVDFFYKPSFWNSITNPPLLNFQWLAIDMLKIVISKEHRNATMVEGQWRTKKVIPDNSVFNSSKKKSIDYTNPYLSKLIMICNDKNINVVLVEMIGSNASRNNFPFIYNVKLADKSKTKIYNLNNYKIGNTIINSKTDWLSSDHLNVHGARKQTAFIYNEILKKQ
ncbi:MAG: hypothetical protein IM568_14185 [Flavobacterium sp.]|nr:hypothetical protein [Flavobacterium sp.]